MQTNLFLPFKKPAYTTLWFSEGLMNLADQMEFLVLVWLVVENTESAFLVGLFSGLRFIGMVLAPVSGTIIDRHGGIKALKATRILYLFYSGTILTVLLLNQFKLWLAFFMATLNGINRASDMVARQTSMATILGTNAINSGVAGFRVVRDITQMLGPLLGALILDSLGIEWSYIAICSVFFMSAVLVFRASRQQASLGLASFQKESDYKQLNDSSTSKSSPFWESFKQGLVYVFKSKPLFMLFILATLYNILVFPVIYGLMPVIAKSVLNTDATGLGRLMFAIYAGALIGTLIIGSVKSFKRPGRTLTIANLGWYLAFLALAPVDIYMWAIIILFVGGFTSGITNVMVEQLLLTLSSKEYRGRVMGTRALAVAALFIGVLGSGSLADATSIQITVATITSLGFLCTIVVTLLLPQLWRIKTSQ